MAQKVSRWSLTAEARFQSQASYVRFVVDKVAMGQVFPEYLRFPLSVSFYWRSIPIYSSITDAI
jgi:hypothetical protein